MKPLVVPAALACLALVGCGYLGPQKAEPTVPAPATCSPSRNATEGTTSVSINVKGQQRTYQLHIPGSYTGKTPVPLVYAFHGRGGAGSQQLLYSGMDNSSNQHGFIVVAPDAIDGQWDFPLVPSQSTSDTDFLTALGFELTHKYCIDESRVYASGMSLGSAMTFVLACAPERKFAAFGGVGASFYRPQCNTSPPAPIVYFHGTKDPIVPFGGGPVAGSPATGPTSRVAPATENMAAWAKHNGCAAKPSEKTVTDTTLIRWTACKDNADVLFYRINGGGHTWPGSSDLISLYVKDQLGKTSDTDATEIMWSFFSKYQLPTN